jgi:hypothetical protein
VWSAVEVRGLIELVLAASLKSYQLNFKCLATLRIHPTAKLCLKRERGTCSYLMARAHRRWLNHYLILSAEGTFNLGVSKVAIGWFRMR